MIAMTLCRVTEHALPPVVPKVVSRLSCLVSSARDKVLSFQQLSPTTHAFALAMLYATTSRSYTDAIALHDALAYTLADTPHAFCTTPARFAKNRLC